MNHTNLAAREDSRAPNKFPHPITNTQARGATVEEWQQARDIFGEKLLLPVICADIDTFEMAEYSKVSADTIRKIPSRFDRDGKASRFGKWQKHDSTAAEVDVSQADPGLGICLRTGHGFAAFDVDTNREAVQSEVYELILKATDGEKPATRYRADSARVMHFLAVAEPFDKVIARLPDVQTDTGKPEREAVEVLGTGQQAVIAGTHKNGARYQWKTGAITQPPAISFECFTKLVADIQALTAEICQAEGFTPDKRIGVAIKGTGSRQHQRFDSLREALAVDKLGEYLADSGNTIDNDGRSVLYIECPYKAQHSGDSGETETAYIMDKRPGESRFHCFHAGCDEHYRNQYQIAELLGVPAALRPQSHADYYEKKNAADALAAFEILNGSAALVEAKAPAETTSTPQPVNDSSAPMPDVRGAFAQWNGKLGDHRDEARELAREWMEQEYENPVELRAIPPDIRLNKKNIAKKGVVVTGFVKLNTSDNFKWMLAKKGDRLARNVMSWEIETFDDTGKRKAATEEDTASYICDRIAIEGLPEKISGNHFNAVAARSSYHPVSRWLHGGVWDGIERVQRVIDCVPVAREDVELRDALLWASFAGCIASLDDDSYSIKFATTLYSHENNWNKTTFIQRIGSVTPGAFRDAIAIDPNRKDSVRNAIFCWIGELGELDQMSKLESGLLKAWMPMKEDTWRPEYSKNYVTKKRQSTFFGTVNKEEFILDGTMSTRFPAIRLAAAIDIERVNQVLGWKWTGDRAELVDGEQLRQYWLEIRHKRNAGKITHVLDAETFQAMRANNDSFVEKGAQYAALLEVITRDATGINWSAGLPEDDKRRFIRAIATGKEFTASDATTACGFAPVMNRMIGKAIRMMIGEGVLKQTRNPKNVPRFARVFADGEQPPTASDGEAARHEEIASEFV